MRPLYGDGGDATVEAVLAVPVLLLMIMVVIQFGLWYHASHTVEAAVQEGVRAARLDGASAEDGKARTEQFVHDAAPTLVQGLQVTASRDGEQARVDAHGTVHSLVPGLHLSVHADAQSPVERFRADR